MCDAVAVVVWLTDFTSQYLLWWSWCNFDETWSSLSLSHTQLLDFNEINGAGCQTIQMRVFGFKLNPHYEVMGVLVKRPLLFAPIRTISYHLSQNQFFIICVLSMVSVDTVFNVIFWGCFWFPPTHGFPMETVNEARSTWFHCQFSVYEHGITPL